MKNNLSPPQMYGPPLHVGSTNGYTSPMAYSSFQLECKEDNLVISGVSLCSFQKQRPPPLSIWWHTGRYVRFLHEVHSACHLNFLQWRELTNSVIFQLRNIHSTTTFWDSNERFSLLPTPSLLGKTQCAYRHRIWKQKPSCEVHLIYEGHNSTLPLHCPQKGSTDSKPGCSHSHCHHHLSIWSRYWNLASRHYRILPYHMNSCTGVNIRSLPCGKRKVPLEIFLPQHSDHRIICAMVIANTIVVFLALLFVTVV